MTRTRYWCACIALVMVGCVAGQIEGTTNNEETGIPTFEEFEAATYLEPVEHGVYIVNGDTPVPNIKQLREFYDALYFSSLIVHRNGNSDAKWSNSQKRNLTYCISDSFGSYKSTLVSAMEQATGGWEQAADIDFVYVSAQDGNCTATNNNVLFDVRPTSNAPYLARAFFPGQGRSSRNVIVDTSAFNSGWPLWAVLAHELGHTLGFRHEHTRPEAGTCYEDSSWRPLTPYDSSSIMHYPQCNGASNTLSFSQLDYDGAAALYGAPTTEQPPTEDPPTDPPPTEDPPSGGTAQTGSDSGSVGKGQSVNYNPLSVVPGSPLEVTISGSGDADLYVRFDSQPTLYEYDCRPYLWGSSETCSLDVPAGASQAYIMIHGYEASNYNLTAEWVQP